MLKSVTNWLGVTKTADESDSLKENKEQARDTAKSEAQITESTSAGSIETCKCPAESDSLSEPKESKSTSEKEATRKDESDSRDSTALHRLEDVSAKAFNTAKDIGNILFNFGKAAGTTVVEQASRLKNAVQDKTILEDLNEEQEKLAAKKSAYKKLEEDAVAPWVGYNEEATMKEQILRLSTDRRHFLTNPPPDVEYEFDFVAMYPVALATLREDANLHSMRFRLVPQRITEENFWRNYFYRVMFIKQSAQLKTLEVQQEEQGTISSGEQADPDDSVTLTPQQLEKHVLSDGDQASTKVKVDEKQEEELGEDWERVLREELEDCVRVIAGDGGGGDGSSSSNQGEGQIHLEVNDDDDEVDLLQQIEQETQDTVH